MFPFFVLCLKLRYFRYFLYKPTFYLRYPERWEFKLCKLAEAWFFHVDCFSFSGIFCVFTIYWAISGCKALYCINFIFGLCFNIIVQMLIIKWYYITLPGCLNLESPDFIFNCKYITVAKAQVIFWTSLRQLSGKAFMI